MYRFRQFIAGDRTFRRAIDRYLDSDRGRVTRESSHFETLRNICGRLIFNGVPTGVEVCYAMQHGGLFLPQLMLVLGRLVRRYQTLGATSKFSKFSRKPITCRTTKSKSVEYLENCQ
jgi:hypothetical protein